MVPGFSAPVETHGRWPLVAVAALGPATFAAARQPRMRPLAALLWHQSEEWVWPGGFLPWINHEVLGSADAEFPIDRSLGFAINVLFGWGLSAVAADPERHPTSTAILCVSHLGNVGLHASWAARHRRYDPGLITAFATLMPVALAGLWRLHADPAVPARSVPLGIVGGVAISAGLVPALKYRLRRCARNGGRGSASAVPQRPPASL